MSLNENQENVAEKIATYLMAEHQNKTGRIEVTNIEEDRLTLALYNILAIVFDNPDFEIDGFVDNIPAVEDWEARAGEIKNATLLYRKDLISAAKKCYAGECSDIDGMIDGLCK